MNRVLYLDRFGDPSNFRLGEAVPASPGPGEVLLRQHVLGVNFVDLYDRRGTGIVKELPAIIGREGVGVVEAVGDGVSDFRPGMRAGYTSTAGAYRDRRIVAADRLVPIPEGVPDTVACPLLMRGMTAHYLVHEVGNLAPGKTALVYGAAGGVGSILAQWAKTLGVHVIGVASSAQKRAAASAWCDAVCSYDREEILSAVRAAGDGRGVHVAFDSVGRDTFEISLAALRVRGTFALYGLSSGKPDPFDVARLGEGSFTLTRCSMGHFTATPADRRARSAAVYAAYLAGAFRLPAIDAFALEEAGDAHRAMEDRRSVGPVVLTLQVPAGQTAGLRLP